MMPIIPIIVALGLGIVTLGIGFWYNWKLALVILIPLLYAGYYTITKEVPKYFGYAVGLNLATMEDHAMFVAGYESGDIIYLLLVFKDEKEPRLISIPKTPENEELLTSSQKRVKEGQFVYLRKPKKVGNKGGNGQFDNNSSGSDLESVDIGTLLPRKE